MLGFFSAHSPWYAISNIKLQRSYKALCSVLDLPSATTLIDICQREYALTVDAIEMHLPSRNKVSYPLDGLTSMKKLAITSVVAYYMDLHWVLCEAQLASMRLIACSFPVLKASSG